jgi:hypothetical protein
MTDGHVGPKRDHVALDAAEQQALVELERSLASMGVPRTARLGAALRSGAPCLLPLGLVLMVAAIPVSIPLSFLGSLLAAAGLGATLDRSARRLRLRRARRRRSRP